MVVAQEQVRKEELAPGSADEVHEFTSPGSSKIGRLVKNQITIRRFLYGFMRFYVHAHGY